MPNWCWNNLEVTGDEKQLREFVEKSTKDKEREFSFNGTYPMPKTLRITAGTHLSFIEKIKRYINIKLYGHDNWYNWSIANWGTKWDACESCINNNDINFFSVSFETAWGPPIDWIDNIMEDFPDLCFELEYEEPGMCYGGILTAQYEEIFDNVDWELEQASECCEGEVYNQDDEEFSLPKHSLERQTRHVGEGKAFQSIEDVPEAFLYPDYQCGICGEECETISMNASQVRPAQIKIK